MKFVKKNKIRMTKDMLILVNLGPGSYSSFKNSSISGQRDKYGERFKNIWL